MKTRRIPRWRQWLARKIAPMARRSSFMGAVVSRLTDDWITSNLSANSDIWGSYSRLLSRSRDISRNNRYAQKIIASKKANILGAKGVTLQMRIMDGPNKPDKLANDTIENAWWLWGRKCTVDGLSWRQACNVVLEESFVAGNALIRRRIDPRAEHPLKLELIEIERLDIDYTGTHGGNRVFMGIEFDENFAVVAYHILNYVGSDPFMTPNRARRRERVDASNIIHVYKKKRPGQIIGIPEMSAILVALHNIEGYEQAEVIAARAAANKMGFLKHPEGAPYEGEGGADGSKFMETAPGQIEDIGRHEFVAWDPKHPTQNYPSFVKTQLQGISSGVAEPYNILANDLEGVNYSSLRGGLLDAREHYMMDQEWFIETFIQPVFEWWLEAELMAGALKMPNGSALPLRKLDKFNSPEWKGRRWPWVDPLKDMQAIELALKLKITSHKDVLGEMGLDFEEMCQNIQQSQVIADLYDVELPKDEPAPALAGPKPPDPEDKDE